LAEKKTEPNSGLGKAITYLLRHWMTAFLSEAEMIERASNFQARVQEVAQAVRQISHQLHPSILEDLGLVAALNELCEEFSAREGIEVAFESEAVPKVLPIDLASCLYRVSQESLHNVLKHA